MYILARRNLLENINAGLEGVVVAVTKITHVDGVKGQLVYRGYAIENLVKDISYEEVAYLLCKGVRPDKKESETFRKSLAAKRSLPPHIGKVLESLPRDNNPMVALRTGLSALNLKGEEWPPSWEQGMEILAKIPTLIAHFDALSKGKKPIEPDPSLGHTENYLYMLQGKRPDPVLVKALDAYLITAADHGMNASTFTARVVTSTQSDMISAITAAIGALKGPLHGGAPSEVDDMLDAIKTVQNAEGWIRTKLREGERIMGFGHRVYKTYDPRAAILKEIVKKLPSENNAQLALSLAVEKEAIALLEEHKPGRNLYPNVEFWAAAILRAVALPRQLYSPTFAIARTAGWIANILEQAENNRLIRPSASYIGPIPKTSQL